MSSSSSTATAGSSDTSTSDEASEGIVLFLSVSVVIGCLCRWLVKRFARVPLPFTVLLLLVGVLMGAVADYGHVGDNVFQDAILAFSNLSPELALYLFLPVLIFDSAFNVHYHLFMHNLWASLLLAFPGALICLFFAAVFARYVFDYGWSWSEALMLGSVLAATDPVAVVALLHDLGSSHQLATLIEGESLLNDGSAFVVYLLTQSILLGGDTSASHLVGSLFQYSLGGPAFGLLWGLVTVVVLEQFLFRDAEIEISLTIAGVYICFWIANEPLNVSAVLAIVVLGLVMSKNRYSISPSVQSALRAVWDVLIFFTNILIFLLSGLIIADKLFGEAQYIRGVDVGWLFLLYVVLHVVRFLSIVLFLPLFRRTNVHLTMREVLMVSWSGMRGGVSLILALITYLQPAYDAQFKARLTFLVSGIVLLTLVVNGMTSRYVLQFLKLNRGSEESRLILNSALLHMRQQTAHAMRGMKDDPKFREVRWTVIRPFLPQKLIEEVKQETERTQTDAPSDALTEQADRVGAVAASPSPAATAATPAHERMELFRRASMSRKSIGDGVGRLLVSTGDSEAEEKQSDADREHDRQMQELIFPPSHPIHRITAQQQTQQHERAAAEPGDVTLLMMPTLMYERVMGPLPDEKNGSREDEKEEVADLPISTARQPYSSSVREQRPSSVRRQSSTAGSRRFQRQPTASALMAIFDEPTDSDDTSNAVLPRSESPAASPSRITLEQASAPSPTDPPPGPSAPPLPYPPVNVRDSSSPHFWQSSTTSQSPRPPSRSRRRQLLHNRQLSSMGESRMWPATSGLSIRKLSLLRELSVRFVTAMQADYARQFGSGLLTRGALRILTAACEQAIDSGSILSQWTFLRQQLRCPPWLSFLYSSRYLVNSVDVPWHIRLFRSAVQHLMFGHLKVCVELTTAFLSANQRLETVLDSFPEVAAIDAEAVEVVQQQVGYLQHRALAAWVDVCEGYGEAHAAVVTRHAAIMLLHFQQREIRSLHSTGMLEQREFDLIIALINAKLVRLDQRGLQMHMSTAVELLQQHPLLHTLTEEHKRRLSKWMRQKRTRRWLPTHQTVWERGQHCPGLVLTVRGTVRMHYEYDTDAPDDELAEGNGKRFLRPEQEHGESHDVDHETETNNYQWQHQWQRHRRQQLQPRRQEQQQAEPRTWSAAVSQLLGRSRQSSPALSPSYQAPSPTSPAPSATMDTASIRNSSRLLDTKGRLSICGAYEMLTGHSTLASCRTVTMAESFMLDGECLEVLMDEDEAMQMLVRAAADDILKARWTHWRLHEHTNMKQYHIAELLKRAQVFRSTQHTTAAGSGGGGGGIDSSSGAVKDAQATEAEEDEAGGGREREQGRHEDAQQSKQSEQKAEQAVGQGDAERDRDSDHVQAQSRVLPLPNPLQPPPSWSRRPSSDATSSSTASQHRISMRYSDVMLIIDGSAVGEGMTRRVKRSRRQQLTQQVQQPTQLSHHRQQPPAFTRSATTAPSASPRLLVPTAVQDVADPLRRPSPSPCPLYLGPCLLRQRQGQLTMSATCLYVRWELRDEEIASLFPPPPRADMRQYARELGLQLRMSAAVADVRDSVEKSDIQPSMRNRPVFVSAGSAAPLETAASAHFSHTTAGAVDALVQPSLSATPALAKLSSASIASTSSGYSTRAPLLGRPIALSEVPSPRLAHYLGAPVAHNTLNASHTGHLSDSTTSQQRPPRRHSVDFATEPQQLRAQLRQRRASTAAATSPQDELGQMQRDYEQTAADEQEDDTVEVEESELEWDPSAASWSTTNAHHGSAAVNRQASRIFAFDIESNNALTV